MLPDRIDILSRRGQEVLMVLYALRELRQIRSKEEVLGFIRENRFYELLPEDKGVVRKQERVEIGHIAVLRPEGRGRE